MFWFGVKCFIYVILFKFYNSFVIWVLMIIYFMINGFIFLDRIKGDEKNFLIFWGYRYDK